MAVYCVEDQVLFFLGWSLLYHTNADIVMPERGHTAS